VGMCVDPLPQCSLNEAFDFAVGARSVRPSEAIFDALLIESFGETPVAIIAAVVGEQAANGDAEVGVVGTGHEEEANGRAMALIGQDGRKGDTGMIIDGD